MNQPTQSRWCYVLVVISLGLSTTGVHAQGTIRGVVRDSEGRAVSGAQIRMLGTRVAALTDSKGHYLLSNVRAGRTRLQISMYGYVDVSSSVDVARNSDVTKNFVLPPTYAHSVWLGCKGFSASGSSCVEPLRPDLGGTFVVPSSGRGILRDQNALRLFWAQYVTTERKDQHPVAPDIDLTKYFVAVVSYEPCVNLCAPRHHVNRIEYGPRETVIVLGEDTIGIDLGIQQPGVRTSGAYFDLVLFPRTRMPVRFKAASTQTDLPPFRDWTKAPDRQ